MVLSRALLHPERNFGSPDPISSCLLAVIPPTIHGMSVHPFPIRSDSKKEKHLVDFTAHFSQSSLSTVGHVIIAKSLDILCIIFNKPFRLALVISFR